MGLELTLGRKVGVHGHAAVNGNFGGVADYSHLYLWGPTTVDDVSVAAS